MIVVIIAGGAGTRLWPLSTPKYPKHLLSINGEQQSLLQRTFQRSRQVSDSVYVLTEASHAEQVQKQLPGLAKKRIIVEADRRGTANCLIAALVHLQSQHPDDEAIAFVAADHYIRDTDGFVRCLRTAGDVSKKSNRIVLVGVEPNRPATGFGYIQKDNPYLEEPLVFNVHSFKEKPLYELAQQYVQSGAYLWNCSYFIASHNTFLAKIRKHAPDMLANYQKLSSAKGTDQQQDIYLSFTNQTIDYALIERIDDLLVIPAAFDWMDLGSYGDLHRAAMSDEQGNHVHGRVTLEQVENSFVQNHIDKPLVVIGIDNVVVINSKDGILVARKDLAQQVGEVSKRLNSR